ncbi:ABC transporter ATP-binding protein [Thermodesulfobacteriota bacterium]
MPDPIIQIENLSKKYLIKHQQQGNYTALRDIITDKVKSLGMRLISHGNHKQSSAHSTTEEFWAIKDISFKVKQGEVIGIIGRNGAGKSTLLKIISRITEPTKGCIRINGRVASLLEVGTGFHPELTGRENIFLNGAILGMRKAEIKSKFDKIVNFAEIEKFIDTPVKRYSSGMYVRLAFAVAAHLEPEILLVDEVLAVGDAAFQKKCLGKMGDVAKEGRTVLFVSHNMGAIQALCSRALLLERGGKDADGTAEDIVSLYMGAMSKNKDSSYFYHEPPDRSAWIVYVKLQTAAGIDCSVFSMTDPLSVECELMVKESSNYTLSLQIKELNDLAVYHFPNEDASFVIPSSPGSHRISVTLPPLNLYPGRYSLRLNLCQYISSYYKQIHEVDNIIFEIQQNYSLCSRPLPRQAGLIFASSKWSIIT